MNATTQTNANAGEELKAEGIARAARKKGHAISTFQRDFLRRLIDAGPHHHRRNRDRPGLPRRTQLLARRSTNCGNADSSRYRTTAEANAPAATAPL